MEILIYIGGTLVLGILTFLFFEKPYIFGTLFVFLYIYGFNVELPGPLDLRGMVTLLLFGRLVILDKENAQSIFNVLFRDKYFWLMFLFLLISYTVTYIFEPKLGPNLKLFTLNIITILIGFIIIKNNKEDGVFFYGFLFAGLLATIDLFFSRFFFGTLHVVRLLDFVRGQIEFFNHNAFGMIAGFGFLYVYLKLIHNEKNKFIFFPLLVILGLGLVLSTSRGSMLGVLVAILLINHYENYKLFTVKRIVFTGIFLVLFGFIISFSLNYLSKSVASGSKLIKVMTQRLDEIPNTFLGKEKAVYSKFGKKKESTISWRLAKWKRDLEKFTERNLTEQLFGSGIGSYKKKFGKARFMAGSGDRQVYTAHNGYINVLIERGAISLILLLIVIFGIILKSFGKRKKEAIYIPLIYIYVALLIGAHAWIEHNKSFLLFGAMIGSFYYFESEDSIIDEDNETETDEEYEDEEPPKLFGEI